MLELLATPMSGWCRECQQSFRGDHTPVGGVHNSLSIQ